MLISLIFLISIKETYNIHFLALQIMKVKQRKGDHTVSYSFKIVVHW
jgi:hypothetical protein